MTCATFLKDIKYDRETKDYAMHLDCELVGFARTYHEAEVTLDQLVWELLNSGICHTATELDGGIPDDDPLPYPLPDDADPPCAGRAIARHFHSRPKSFIATLRQFDPAAWLPLAQAYAEWRGTTPEAALDTWLLAVQGTSVPANARPY